MDLKLLKCPEDVVYPGENASLIEHVSFLLEARRFVAEHKVPEDRKQSINQYSHAGSAIIGEDDSLPAITNCSYEYFGRKFVSIGFPLFIDQAPFLKDNDLNPAFNNVTLWESVSALLRHYAGDLGWAGNTKYGHYRPTNHTYIETPVSEETFNRSQTVIEYYTRTDATDPKVFLKELDSLFSARPSPEAAPGLTI